MISTITYFSIHSFIYFEMNNVTRETQIQLCFLCVCVVLSSNIHIIYKSAGEYYIFNLIR
jgi:hypothetical protein